MQQVRVTDVPALLASFDAGARPVVLDVREPWELQAAPLVLDGVPTVCIPLNDVPRRFGELAPDEPVLALCHHGVRSAHAAAFLQQQGFAQVFNIAGGIDAWSRHVDASVPLY